MNFIEAGRLNEDMRGCAAVFQFSQLLLASAASSNKNILIGIMPSFCFENTNGETG